MLSNEVIQMIQKYQKNNAYEIEKIFSNLQDIVEQLDTIRFDLTRMFKKSIDDNKFPDDLCADIALLNQEIKIIRSLLKNTDNFHEEEYETNVLDINFYSVIVLSNTYKCSSEHQTKDLVGRIPILDQHGKLTYKEVNLSYCYSCKKITMLRSDFNRIHENIMCKIVDETSILQETQNDSFGTLNKEHLIKQYGYNVQAKKNLSSKQRQIILATLIEADILNRREIINHIEWTMQNHKNKPSSQQAIRKWTEDIEFVRNYKIGSLPSVFVDNLILKYKKSKNDDDESIF